MTRLTLCRPGRYRQRAVRYHVSVGAFCGAPMQPNSVLRYDLAPGIHELTLEYSRGRSVVVAVQLSDKPRELIFLPRSRLLLLNAPPAIIDAETGLPMHSSQPRRTVAISKMPLWRAASRLEDGIGAFINAGLSLGISRSLRRAIVVLRRLRLVTAPPLDDPRADAWKAFDTSTGRRLAGWLLYPFLFVLDGVSGGAWQSDDFDIPVFGRKRLVGWGVRLKAQLSYYRLPGCGWSGPFCIVIDKDRTATFVDGDMRIKLPDTELRRLRRPVDGEPPIQLSHSLVAEVDVQGHGPIDIAVRPERHVALLGVLGGWRAPTAAEIAILSKD